MVTLHRVHLQTVILLFFIVHLSRPVCVEVPSDTEAVLGTSKRLTCISCKTREEVEAKTSVNWYFTPTLKNLSTKVLIYHYGTENPEVDGQFQGRLVWNGSQDLQDLSIQILKVTSEDKGFYQCQIQREFKFDFFVHTSLDIKNITLDVKAKASDDITAFYSQIMMYVLLVFLTFWLLVEMVYCYRKISKSDEQAQDAAY